MSIEQLNHDLVVKDMQEALKISDQLVGILKDIINRASLDQQSQLVTIAMLIAKYEKLRS